MKFEFQTVEQITPDMRGFFNIAHDDYHDGAGVSSTRVKAALKSHAAYTHPIDDSSALAFGRAFHAALLEPVLFDDRWVILDGHPNSNAYKAAKQAALECGQEVISASDLDDIRNMIPIIKDHPEWTAGFPEVMAITRDKETGLQIKCKIDLLSHAIVDFKTTSGAISSSDFLYDIVKWRYHVSAAFYQDIVTDITGERMPFILVPVTKNAPFECEFYQLDDALLDEGRKLYKAGLRRIVKWASTDPRAEKKLRMLNMTPRVGYVTQEILSFIES